jgi:hypothetical protein
MKKLTGRLGILLFSSLAALGSTLNVTSSATPAAGGIYDYSYNFAVSGAGTGFDNIYLGSNDLSPLNLVIKLNSAATADWSYLGNDTPQNYLQFFSTSATPLTGGESLQVTFESIFAPSNTGFALALNSVTSDVSNQVNGVTAPSTAPVPEPATVGLLLTASLMVAGRIKRFRGR